MSDIKPPYEYHRAKRIKSNPIKIDDIDTLITALKRDMTATDSIWWMKLIRFCISAGQIIMFWIFIGIRNKLLNDEIEVLKQEYEIAQRQTTQTNINNTFKL